MTLFLDLAYELLTRIGMVCERLALSVNSFLDLLRFHYK